MKSSLIVFVALFCFSQALEGVKEEEGVLVLTKDNFEELTQKIKYLMVEFCKYFSDFVLLVFFSSSSLRLRFSFYLLGMTGCWILSFASPSPFDCQVILVCM